MPRRREVPKRDILPDPKFNSQDLTKFVNVIMLDGKKAVAERIVYGALTQIETKGGKNALEVFSAALSNVQADGRSEKPSCRWRELSGPGRSASGSPHGAGYALAARGREEAQRKIDAASASR